MKWNYKSIMEEKLDMCKCVIIKQHTLKNQWIKEKMQQKVRKCSDRNESKYTTC